MKKSLHCNFLPINKLVFFSFFIIAIIQMSSFTAKSQAGKALQFDGTNDYVSLPLVITGDYTKEVWINASSTTAFPNILSGTGTALFINNGRLAAGHSTGSFGQLLDPVVIAAGTWYHVAVTYNASTGDMKLYKNGILVQSATSVPAYTETLLELGRFSSANFFAGIMDEVRIWDTERTAAEILATKDCELTGDEPGLLAYYNFEQGIAAGNNSSLTLLNDGYDNCVTSTGTLVNFALTGPSSNFIAPGAIASGACAGSFSNINLVGNGICINSGDASPSAADHTFFGDFGVVPLTRTFTIQNTGTAVLNIGALNIAGANAADFTVISQPALSVAAGSSTNFTVSFSPSGSNGIKTAIVTVNNSDTDEATYTYAISGNFAGQGKALQFDGINDRIDLPFVFSGSYTKEAWIQTNFLGSFPNILSGNGTTGTALFLNNGRLAAGHGPSFSQVLDAAVLSTSTWYHVAVTYNAGTGQMNLYKDGVLVSSATAPAYTETLQQIGTFAGANFFWGSIDEVRFWNVERSAAEILAAKNCELNGTEAGLIAYYNFNQGVQGGNNAGLTLLNDLNGNCPLNGTLVNFALNGNTSNWIAPGGTLPSSCTAQVSNISVSGNSICIQTGDASPSIADNTDFGVIPSGNNADKIFVIHNNGGAVLNITNVTIAGVDASSFSIIAAPAATVLPGFSTSFTVRFAPLTVGVKNATVQISNNDADEASYLYAIVGEATAPVPVTMLYFKASLIGKTAKLSWETSFEINNAGFEVQRSTDGGASWELIGFVQAANQPYGSRYGFNDPAPLKGINLYRLVQVDIDHRRAISSIQTVNFAELNSSINLYPNPVNDKVTLTFNDSKLMNSLVKITNASGVVVSTIKLTTYRQQVDLSMLPGGLYFVSFIDGTVQRMIKL